MRQPASDLTAPRRGLIFAVISAALMMSTIDATIVATALHTLQSDLQTSVIWAGWTIAIYSLGLVLCLPLAGRLADYYGERRVLVTALTIFSVASLMCGLAPTIEVLVAMRLVQAVGGAGVTPSATGIVVRNFGRSRDRALSLFGSIFPVGSVLGPILGGIFVDQWSWRGVFLVNVPIGALLIAATLRLIPADPRRRTRVEPRLGLPGMAFFGLASLGLMTVLSSVHLDARDLTSPVVVGSCVVVGASVIAFLRHSSRSPTPFMAPQLLWGRGFGVVNIVNVIHTGWAAGLTTLIPLYVTLRYGWSALGAGSLLIAEAVGVFLLSLAATLAIRRTGYRWPMFTGTVLSATGFLGIAASGHDPSLAWLVASTAAIGAGSGWASPATRNASIQLAPERAAAIAGMRSTARHFGITTSVSVATALSAQSGDTATSLAVIFAAYGAFLVITAPLALRVPDHRGSW